MIYKANDQVKQKLVPMFKEFNSTVVLSCLQGHMGEAWVDNIEKPTVAQITVGIFVYFAGDSNCYEAEELLNHLPEFTLAIVATEDWKKKVESVHKGSYEKFSRYEFYKNRSNFDRNQLQRNLDLLPKGYDIKQMNLNIVKMPSLHNLSEDFISTFRSKGDFISRGIGFAILHENVVVCGATSYSIYDDGIEIEIATHPDYRQKGLATITASALILECLDRGLYPSWEGANMESVKLAEKLGYQLKTPYDTYFIDC